MHVQSPEENHGDAARDQAKRSQSAGIHQSFVFYVAGDVEIFQEKLASVNQLMAPEATQKQHGVNAGQARNRYCVRWVPEGGHDRLTRPWVCSGEQTTRALRTQRAASASHLMQYSQLRNRMYVALRHTSWYDIIPALHITGYGFKVSIIKI